MARKRKSAKTININAGTAWFLATILVSLVAAFVAVDALILFLILGICGAMVAIYNIRFEEEASFLLATSALFITVLVWNVADVFGVIGSIEFVAFLFNLIIGLGVSALIIAIALIFKLAIDK